MTSPAEIFSINNTKQMPKSMQLTADEKRDELNRKRRERYLENKE